MFTGIIKDIGELVSANEKNESLELKIASSLPISEFGIGTSISVDGVCLTVETSFYNTQSAKSEFTATLVPETLSITRFSEIRPGEKLNLEPSLKIGDAVAGHFVYGHVDFCGELLNKDEKFTISIPGEYMKFFPRKSSICIQGISLTVADVNDGSLNVAIIPETLQKTSLSSLPIGSKLHIEIDMIARYLNNLNK